ncbi:MAG: MGMT family protein [Bacteroidota bacterium]
MPKNLSGSFFEEVYEVAKLIPRGRVTTYGAIAHYLGSRGSARLVGWALNKAVYQVGVPAHRVVNRQGLLTGKRHFLGKYSMQQLLASEGVTVRGDQVQGFAKLFWDPSAELTRLPLL